MLTPAHAGDGASSRSNTKPGAGVDHAARFVYPPPARLGPCVRQLRICQSSENPPAEYGEVIKDNYTEHDHMELIVRQGKALGLTLSSDDVAPLPATMATLYAWAWMTREKSWLEGLASLTITEWANDDRLLQDFGGGLSRRMAKRWMDDLGFGWEQMPNFKVHAEADEEHSDMFLEDLEKFATGEKEALAYQAAKESMELLVMFRAGIAREMERLSR